MVDEADVCSKISEAVKIAGFLDKKGSMLWKRYWFVLEDRLLLYYRSQLEYLNLSPCRGSVNMSLVSSVQPRRNSRDPVIHIVSRSSTLILKAYDRETQAKWLQSLLESMGKGPSPYQHLSCENLPSQLNSLPRSRHTGSLDVVWRKQLTPTTGIKPDPTEEQVTTSAADSRHSTLGRIKTALSRRSSSDPDTRIPKRHRESFLKKIIGKSKGKNETSETREPESEEDPFYDTIGSNSNSLTPYQEILPGATMNELKQKLAEKENEKPAPPELPPRVPTSTNALIHGNDADDSEESDLSGHYQVIRRNKPLTETATNMEFSEQVAQVEANNRILTEQEKMDIYALYSIPKSKSNDSCSTSEYLTPSASKECQVVSEDSNHNLVDKTENNIKEALYQMRTKEGIEMLIKELKEIEGVRWKDQNENTTTITLPEEGEKEDNRQVTTLLYESNPGTSEPLIIEIRHDPNEVVETKYNPEEDEGVTAFREEFINEADDAIEDSKKELTDTINHSREEVPESVRELTEAILEIGGDSNEIGIPELVQDSQEVPPEIAEQNKTSKQNKEIYLEKTAQTEDLLLQFKQTTDSLFTTKFSSGMEGKGLLEVEEGVSDLNVLLKKLTELTSAPLLEVKSSVENPLVKDEGDDPDYDVPRPHTAVASRISEDLDRLPATEFFTKVEDDACSSENDSVEPDSLEAKKELIEMCSKEDLMIS